MLQGNHEKKWGMFLASLRHFGASTWKGGWWIIFVVQICVCFFGTVCFFCFKMVIGSLSVELSQIYKSITIRDNPQLIKSSQYLSVLYDGPFCKPGLPWSIHPRNGMVIVQDCTHFVCFIFFCFFDFLSTNRQSCSILSPTLCSNQPFWQIRFNGHRQS